jgi:hypothetical protein
MLLGHARVDVDAAPFFDACHGCSRSSRHTHMQVVPLEHLSNKEITLPNGF